MKYIIWGAGDRGKRIFYHMNTEDVVAFIDNNVEKQKELYCNKKVIGLAEYKEKYFDCIVVISPVREESVIAQLEKEGIDKYFCLSDCPGEFQGTNPRDFFKEYVSGIIDKDKDYVIYGCALYAFILNDWIKAKTGRKAKMIFHKSCNEAMKKFVSDKLNALEITSLCELKNEEVLVTVEQDIPLIREYTSSITNVFDCTDQIEQYYNPRIEAYKGLHAGERCFIVATGPSLRVEDLELLRANNEICFSMNRIWHIFDETLWRPDYYAVVDNRFLREDSEIMEDLKVKAAFVGDTWEAYWNVAHKEKIIKFHHDYTFLRNVEPKFSEDCARKMYHAYTVTYNCLQLAVYMGFKEIYLLGVDATSPERYRHFCDAYDTQLIKQSPVFTEENIRGYKAARKYAEEHGIHIYNATRGGELEIFERKNLEDVLK